MKPETLKKELKKIEWYICEDFTLPELPACQGLLIKHLIEHYKIPFKQVGYHMDIVGIRTNKQTMMWKDNGIGARFLGIIDNATGDVHQHKDDTTPVKTVLFETRKELWKEIDKRDYDGILGLKAKVTEEEYMDALEAMPPMKMGSGWFIMSEALSDNLYMKYSEDKGNCFCEVIKLEDEVVMEAEGR